MDMLHLQVAQVPRSPDLANFVLTTVIAKNVDKNWNITIINFIIYNYELYHAWEEHYPVKF